MHKITAEQITAVLDELSQFYAWGEKPRPISEVAQRSWYKALSQFGHDIVKAAVERHCQTSESRDFPVPGQVVALCRLIVADLAMRARTRCAEDHGSPMLEADQRAQNLADELVHAQGGDLERVRRFYRELGRGILRKNPGFCRVLFEPDEAEAILAQAAN
jgi:hypothetical protein